jgi:hypothetical protein
MQGGLFCCVGHGWLELGGPMLTDEQIDRLYELADMGLEFPENMTEDERAELVKLYLIKNHAIH